MKVSRIITHPGKAHFDEVLACALALHGISRGLYGEPTSPNIIRREPTEKELGREDIFCIDVGRDYSPAKNNYDHHQCSDGSLRASFMLVAEDMGIASLLEEAVPWTEFWDLLDRQGPQDAAEAVGVSGNMSALIDPLGQWVVGKFGQSSKIGAARGSAAPGPGSGCFYNVLLSVGESIFTQAVEYRQKRRRVEEKITVIEEDSPGLDQESVRLAWLDEKPDKQIMREMGVELDLDFSITRSRDNYALYSYSRSGVDLSEARERELNGLSDEVEFCHPQGFLLVLKTPQECLDALEAIIQ